MTGGFANTCKTKRNVVFIPQIIITTLKHKQKVFTKQKTTTAAGGFVL